MKSIAIIRHQGIRGAKLMKKVVLIRAEKLSIILSILLLLYIHMLHLIITALHNK